MKKLFTLFISLGLLTGIDAQNIRILFDATKAETAGNADWVIDADVFNLSYTGGPAVAGAGGNEANAQQIPTPAQSGINAGTAENYWKGALSAWGVDCVKKGYTVETLPYNGSITYGNGSNPQDLSNYKVFIVCEPNIVFSPLEKTALLNFVYNGGGLFMVSDHTISDRNNDGWDSPAIWNDFMTNNGSVSDPFGFSFDLANISQSSFNVPALPGDSLLHGPMGDVTELQWFNGTTMTMHPADNPTIKAVTYTTGSAFNNSNVMCVCARYGQGKIVGFGDSSPCDDGTGDTNDGLFNGYFNDAAGNHQRLLMNATIWLATSNSTIPVRFINVNAQIINNATVNLSWKVNETAGNGVVYTIERSANGTDFYPLGSVTGNQYSPVSTYNFTDVHPLEIDAFYRVLATERSGNKQFSPVVRVTNAIISALELQPNPVHQYLQVYYTPLSNKGNLQITDLSGRKVLSQSLAERSNSISISVEAIPPGTYLLQVVETNKPARSKLFIKH